MTTGDPNATSATRDVAFAQGGDAELTAGTVVGEYTIEQRIGKGGFGTVYRGVHPLIGKTVAIKVLSRRYSADEEMVSRFQAEARAVNQIRHRNIIDIFSFGALPDGRAYYVMELLDGQPLDVLLEARGQLTVAEALPILRGIARALAAAHGKGIAHRDLKPENVFLVTDEDGPFPKLLDFGIAKLTGPDDQLAHKTGTGVPLGTPYYMSPEQCRGRDVDYRTDIYSFGILVYRLLTGTYPFEGELIEILHHQMHEEPPPPSSRNPTLAPEVDAAVAWMMRKDAAERPQTMLDAVSALAPTHSGILTPPSVGIPPSPPRSAAISAAHGYLPTMAPGAMAAETVRSVERAPESPRRRGGLLLLAIVAVLASAGIVFAVITVQRAKQGRTTPAPVVIAPLDAAVDAATQAIAEVAEAGTTDASAPPPPALDAGSSTRLVVLTGTPRNAKVFLGDELLGPADAPVALPRSGDDIALRIEAAGYQPGTVIVRPTDTSRAVKLKKQPRQATGTDPAESDDNGILDLPPEGTP